MKYPKLKREKLIRNIYRAFIQLKDIGAEDIKDTLVVHSDSQLDIAVDIDKDDKPCGIEINYYKE